MDGEGGGEVSAVLKRFIEKFSVGVKTFTCNYLHLATVTYKPLGECQLFGGFVDIGKGDDNSYAFGQTDWISELQYPERPTKPELMEKVLMHWGDYVDFSLNLSM